MKSTGTKPNEQKTKRTKANENETKPKSKKFNLSVDDETLHRYIQDGLKREKGVSISGFWTNADGGFIVYGSGLEDVK